jgi:putative CRISPR-associated protein (TIGR02620 family)
MKVLVTRHEALIEYFSNMGTTFDKVITHATVEDVTGNDVYGVLPLHLASLANTVTTVDMDLPAEMRGKELSLSDIETYFTGMSTYQVKKI